MQKQRKRATIIGREALIGLEANKAETVESKRDGTRRIVPRNEFVMATITVGD